MFNSFTTALSALNATSTAVDIVGNNLANLNTVGYKANNVQFADLMTQQLGGSATLTETAFGVGPAQAVRQFTQGAIQQTAGGLNAAIQGNGFFVVTNSDNQTLYTRAGNFSLDASGTLRTASGAYVQGWNATGGVVNTNAAVGNILVPMNGVLPAIATTSMSVTVNLNAAGEVGKDSGTFSAPIQIVDSLGGIHTLTATFTKTAANQWDYEVTIPDEDLGIAATTPPTPPTPLVTGSVEFDGTGKLTSPAPGSAPIDIDISGLVDGANDMNVQWTLFDGNAGLITQFGQGSGVSGASQDGTPAGQITNVGIADGGLIMANFSNGQQTVVGMLAVASIQNPETLVAVGNNNLQPTSETAAAAIGIAGTTGRGQIRGSALESSTVDIATEFTHLITYQRSYQANSRVISTSDQMVQDVMNLIR